MDIKKVLFLLAISIYDIRSTSLYHPCKSFSLELMYENSSFTSLCLQETNVVITDSVFELFACVLKGDSAVAVDRIDRPVGTAIPNQSPESFLGRIYDSQSPIPAEGDAPANRVYAIDFDRNASAVDLGRHVCHSGTSRSLLDPSLSALTPNPCRCFT